jgi:hypothetical protein
MSVTCNGIGNVPQPLPTSPTAEAHALTYHPQGIGTRAARSSRCLHGSCFDGKRSALKLDGSKDTDEQHLTAQGCAQETTNPGDWVCILVRCDQPGPPPSLHPAGSPWQNGSCNRRVTEAP